MSIIGVGPYVPVNDRGLKIEIICESSADEIISKNSALIVIDN